MLEKLELEMHLFDEAILLHGCPNGLGHILPWMFSNEFSKVDQKFLYEGV